MRGKLHTLLAAAAVMTAIGASAGPAWAEDYYDGLRAYDAGRHEEAARIWRRVAETGDAKAQFRMGKLHENGEGVERDYVEALFWYTLAQRNGNQDASVAAYFLRRNLTKGQQETADRRANAWQPRKPGDLTQTGQTHSEAVNGTEEVAPRSREKVGEKDRSNWLESAVPGSVMRRRVVLDDVTRNYVWQFEENGFVYGRYTVIVNRTSRVSEQNTDVGHWRTRNGQLCISWDKWVQGRENCYRVMKLTDGRWRLRHMKDGNAGDGSIVER